MSKDYQLKKCLWILDVLLRNKRGLSYEELMEEWRGSAVNDFETESIPKRTFSNHLRYIEDIFGVSVSYNARTNRYFILNREEIYDDEFKNRMLSGFSVNNILEDSERLRDRIMLESIPSGENFIIDILHAMQKGCMIQVIYQRFGDDNAHQYVLAPYFLKLFKRRWYMVAKRENHEDLRVYALDRVKELSPTATHFKCPSDANARAYFFDCYGIEHNTADYDVETIKLKVYNTHHKCDYLRSLPLHHSQRELERNKDYSIFELKVFPTYDFLQELLSHGNEIEVLEPKWVRDEMKEKISNMLKLYAK